MVQLIHLRTLTAPSTLAIFQKTPLGEKINVTSAFLGPYSEGSELELSCEAGGGRPTPSVTWRLGRTEVIELASEISSLMSDLEWTTLLERYYDMLSCLISPLFAFPIRLY